MNIGDLLTQAGTTCPDHPAFVFEDRSRSYAESLRRADACCHALVELGVRPGDRVAIVMRNCPEYLEVMFAVWKAGAVVVPLNASFTPAEVGWHLADSGAVVAVTDTAGAGTLAAVAPAERSTVTAVVVHGPLGAGAAAEVDLTDVDLTLVDLEDLVAAAPTGPFEAVEVADTDLAWLAYTSGTTGRPKGAVLTHGVLLAQVLTTLADVARLEHEHVGMHAAPLSHGSGHNALVFTMKACTQVIHRSWGFDPALFLAQVERYRVASLFLVPTQIKLVVEHPDVARHDLSSLEWIAYGGAPMYRADQKRALDVLGPVLVQIFGQTESPMSGTVLRREEHALTDEDDRVRSVGRVRNGLQLAVLGPDGRRLPPGESGEICLRGPTVMAGYWNRPDATEETLAGGWLHTGDVGRLDERGYLYILDRLKDMIISGGLNVYPHEVEDVLLAHPDVTEACVIGIPHEKWGESVHAVLVARPGADPEPDALIAFAGERLAGYKKPKSLEFVTALPRTTYGKVAKREVRRPYWAHLDRVL